ncbi:aspartate kinase [Bryobacter aggregatus]|uniref:aspartate kinase n=1 Tax=Bryobacter aggregatus TaxID=360054 RepID=UPI001EE39609|nr:aspartate kinase [Bryobacter aggregatus]
MIPDLLVMKFGGTSMGSADRMRVAAQICVDAARTRPVAIVVSAMSKVTDLLLSTLRAAEEGDKEGVKENIRIIEKRHADTCQELLPADRQDAVLSIIRGLIEEFERLSSGILMLAERPPRSVDEALSIGERLSAALIAAYLDASGTPAVAVNAREVIVTDSVFGNASPIMDFTIERAAKILVPKLLAGTLPVITGFNGATVDGRPTTLGRGGSDFSASILASALDAKELWIWTDVDGIMSADPRLVPDAAVLDVVTYREAAELAYNGAKVLHPRTIAPLVDKGIPVWSKNSFNLTAPGTMIAAQAEGNGPRAVTSMASVALISIEPASPVINGTMLMGRVLEALGRANAEVLAFTSSSYQQSFCFLIRKDEVDIALSRLKAELSLELAHEYVHPIEVDDNVGLLAVVGEGMAGHPGLAGRIFTAISADNVNIIAIAQGSSELTISIVVRRDGLERAVKAVHAECRMGVPVT